MSSIDWEQHIKDNILNFRKSYENLPEETRALIKSVRRISLQSLNNPTQVVVLDFDSPHPYSFVILHSEEIPDMKTIVFGKEELKGFFQKGFFEKMLSGKPELLGLVDSEALVTIRRELETYGSSSKWICQFWSFSQSSVYMFSRDRLFKDKYEFSFWAWTNIETDLQEIDRLKLREKIAVTVGNIKRDAQGIQAEELRTKIVEKTERLEDEIGKLDKKFEEQINQLRDTIVRSRIQASIQEIHGDVYGPAIQAVSSQVSFSQQVNDAFRQAYGMVETKGDVPPEQKEEIKKNLNLLEEELNKKEPDAGKIQGLWKWLRRNASWVVPTLVQVILEGTKMALGN